MHYFQHILKSITSSEHAHRNSVTHWVGKVYRDGKGMLISLLCNTKEDVIRELTDNSNDKTFVGCLL